MHISFARKKRGSIPTGSILCGISVNGNTSLLHSEIGSSNLPSLHH